MIIANQDFKLRSIQNYKYEAGNTKIIVIPTIITNTANSYDLTVDIKILDQDDREVASEFLSYAENELSLAVQTNISDFITFLEERVKTRLQSINDGLTFR